MFVSFHCGELKDRCDGWMPSPNFNSKITKVTTDGLYEVLSITKSMQNARMCTQCTAGFPLKVQ